ncbi:formylglycine-generating enzyme family protein [Pendulispora brunnea]|uniref:Formylglycine-generating enzyme family protein n=1 Tax=Pendulispora brunnea TaxID=2905690 RepID=A0ABZ2JZZ4_9BACT
MTSRWRWFAVAVAGVAGVSLTYVTSCYDFAYSPGGEDGSLPDSGSGEDVQQPQDAGFDSGCPSTRGPSMVQAHGLGPDASKFCIDSTEVTREQYAAFLAANVATTGQPKACAFNKSFVPGDGFWPDGGTRTGNHPVTGADWCDAYAYCKWAGKRLCGDIKGGPHPLGKVNESPDADTSQWRLACTHAEDSEHLAPQQDFPYGGTYNSRACNGKDQALGTTAPVASQPDCVGGFPGIYDMSGNANEWEDSCGSNDDDAGPEADPCVCRGGSYVQNEPKMHCAQPFTCRRDYEGVDVGFRCCK